MTSTQDCKTLLEQDTQTKGRGVGGWKRLSKRQAGDGVERIFSNKEGNCFARVLENDQGLIVERVADTLEGVDMSPSINLNNKKQQQKTSIRLFDMFPPEDELDEETLRDYTDVPDTATVAEAISAYRQGFSGRFVFGLVDDDIDEERWVEDGELDFFFGYETDEGYLFDQHSEVYSQVLPLIFPDNNISVDCSEGMHCVMGSGDVDKLWKKMVARFEEVGAVPLKSTSNKNGVGMVDPSDSLLDPDRLKREKVLGM